jgi:pimeloyl-ACP methyl ester carboxylesterase
MQTNSKTIVFIHGMFVTPLCWQAWLGFFGQQGYRCHAPAYPAHDGPAEALRQKHPNSALAQLTLAQVVEHYAAFIQTLPEKPILVGHSMGGLIVQILVARQLAQAGVLIDGAPPVGVFTPKFSFLKSNFPMINPFISTTTPYLMPFEHFQYTFVHTLPLSEQQAAYQEYLVPESRGVARGALTAIAKIDFGRPHVPLLFIAGELDQIVPASLNQSNLAAYKDAGSKRSFKQFDGRTHFILGQKNWQEVAGFVAQWLKTG